MHEEKICQIWIKVSPKSYRSECLGWDGNFLKIKIAALPIDGNANEELIAFLSKKLKISKSRIRISKGQTSKIKQIQLDGLSLEDVKKLLF